MNQPPSPGLTLLSASTIVDSLYPHLSVADVLNIGRVCHAAYLAVKAWLPSAYNINKHLEPFFGNLETTLRFRSVQAATGTIISGSQALQFFDRARYINSDLDIYTPCPHTFTVGAFLLSIGYQFQPTSEQLATPHGADCRRHLEEASSRRQSRRWSPTPEDVYAWAYLEQVFTFTKEASSGEQALKVQVMAVDPEYSPLACILQFHSTLVMNVITHDRAYALFPRQTFLDRTGITLGNNGNLNSLKKAYEKYIARNFRIPVAALPDQIDLMSFGHRRIGDSKTWSIELDTTGVTIPDWLFVATAKFGRPLMMANGFTLRTSQPTIPRKPDQNPSRDRYSDGNSLLCFEAFYSPILHFPLILPLHSRPFRVFSLQNHKWTGYTGTYSFIAAQERFEIEKYGLPELNRATIRPELIPGWQYWDLEVLRLVQKDFEKWPTNA